MSRHSIPTLLIVWSIISLLVTGCQPIQPVASERQTAALTSASTITLPNGFQPEGIAVGRDMTAYVGSVGSGAIYKLDLETGEGSILVAPQAGRGALGMAYDRRTDYLYVADRTLGSAFVYDGINGELVQQLQLSTNPKSVINDVALSDVAVFFTDSSLPVFYVVPLSANGELLDSSATRSISLTGEFEYLPEGINGNGIVASTDGKKLIIAHTDQGKLYVVDATTGGATHLPLDGDTEIYHDGLVLVDNRLYIINYNDKVYAIDLDPAWTAGKLLRTITDPSLEAPATAAIYGDSLYVVNARWDAEQTSETKFWLTTVSR